jgi:hypothetical protein
MCEWGNDVGDVVGAQKEKYKQGSFAIREGQTVNLDVTAPGATVALGLIYLRSNNAALAAWLRAPATAYHLDFVRPDLLMLRIISRGSYLIYLFNGQPTKHTQSKVKNTVLVELASLSVLSYTSCHGMHDTKLIRSRNEN